MGIPVNTMKWIDLHLGVPACWCLTQARRIAGLFRGSLPAPGPIARILYIELSEMGSMVAAGPVMRSFRDRHPDAQMFFLTFRQNRACLDVLQLVPPENVITIETGNLAIFLRSLWAALRRMRRLRFDAVVDFELFSRISAILAQLSGARLSVGFDRLSLEGLYRGHLKTHPVGYNHYAHISRNFLSLLEALDGAPLEQGLLKKRMEETPLPIPRPPRDEARRAELWRRLQTLCPALAARSRLVILNPNAGPLLPIRAWPLDRYIELARRLLADPDVCVLVMGTAEASARLHHDRESELNAMTDAERAYLYDAIRLLPFELGLRFFQDYLAGDKYFKVKKPKHNLVRTRCQIALAKDMQRKMNAMTAIVRDCARRYRG